ncbi:hypothetical protein GQ54DRAFT_286614 [Martensiomyces pterosporus]|nr:hypothetical protein GQ54DRAFT_286614 [Martensiomyces pterosporus]
MEDLLEYPRFQMKIINEIIPESQLQDVVTSLKHRASELTHKAQQERESHTADEEEEEGEGEREAHANATEVIHDPVVVKVGKEWKFLCRVPRVDHGRPLTDPKGEKAPDKEKEKEAEEEKEGGVVGDPRDDERQAIQRGLELLSPLKSNCISYTHDWWTYEYCHDQYVRQYHQIDATEGSETIVIQYRLGDHSRRKRLLALPSHPNEKGRDEAGGENEATRTTQIKRVGRKQFLAQTWGGGTVCDITRRPREVEIQFHCDPNNPERISHVKEVSMCQYLMIINTPRLCVDPSFYDSAASVVYDIACQEVIKDEKYEELVANGMLLDNSATAIDVAKVDSAAEKVKEKEEEEKESTEQQDEQPAALADSGDAEASKKANDKRSKPQPHKFIIDPNDPEQIAQLLQREEELRKILEKVYGGLAIQIKQTTRPKSTKKRLQKGLEKGASEAKEQQEGDVQQQQPGRHEEL